MADALAAPARHEAGHAVAAVLLHARLRLVSVDPDIARSGTDGCTLAEAAGWRRAGVVWAGVLMAPEGGGDDWAYLRTLPAETALRGLVLAREVLARHGDAIERVARALQFEQTLTRGRVEELIYRGPVPR